MIAIRSGSENLQQLKLWWSRTSKLGTGSLRAVKSGLQGLGRVETHNFLADRDTWRDTR